MIISDDPNNNPQNSSSFEPTPNLFIRQAESIINKQLSLSLKEKPIIPPDFPLSPDQREIYYKIYYLKHSFDSLKLDPSFRFSQISQKVSTDVAFAEVLKNKTMKLRENIKSQAEILQFLIISHEKAFKRLKEVVEELFNQREKIYLLSDAIVHRRDFEQKLNFEMIYYRSKLDCLRDQLQETEGYLMVFATIDKANTNIIIDSLEKNYKTNELDFKSSKLQTSKETHNIHELDFLTVKSQVLQKYDLFMFEAEQLDIAYQSFYHYYSLDRSSPTFLLKTQSLINKLIEISQFADKGFEEVVRNTKMVSSCLRHLGNYRILREHEAFFENVEMSYILVEKIIYIRLEKLTRLSEGFLEHQNAFFEGITKFNEKIENIRFNEGETRRKQGEFRQFRGVVKGLKKEIKILRDDNKNMLFIKIRLIQSKKAIKIIKLFINQLTSVLFLANYLENCLEKELAFGVFLIEQSEKPGLTSLSARQLQAKIRLFQERLKELMRVPALKPINHIPRRLFELLDIAYENLEKKEKSNDFNDNLTDKNNVKYEDLTENDDFSRKLKEFERKYANFIIKPFTNRSNCLILQKDAKNLQKEALKDPPLKESLSRKDSLLEFSNDLFFDLDNLREKWLEDRDCKKVDLEEEGLVKQRAEKIQKLTEKNKENEELKRFSKEIGFFIGDFQGKKKENWDFEGKKYKNKENKEKKDEMWGSNGKNNNLKTDSENSGKIGAYNEKKWGNDEKNNKNNDNNFGENWSDNKKNNNGKKWGNEGKYNKSNDYTDRNLGKNVGDHVETWGNDGENNNLEENSKNSGKIGTFNEKKEKNNNINNFKKEDNHDNFGDLNEEEDWGDEGDRNVAKNGGDKRGKWSDNGKNYENGEKDKKSGEKNDKKFEEKNDQKNDQKTKFDKKFDQKNDKINEKKGNFDEEQPNDQEEEIADQKKENIRQFLKQSLETYRNNDFLKGVIVELLRSEDKKTKEYEKNKAKGRIQAEKPKKMGQNNKIVVGKHPDDDSLENQRVLLESPEEIYQKSQEFKHKPLKKAKTPNLRKNLGDYSSHFEEDDEYEDGSVGSMVKINEIKEIGQNTRKKSDFDKNKIKNNTHLPLIPENDPQKAEKNSRNEGESNDSDYIYGWDTYYISNALNEFFGTNRPMEIPIKTPKNSSTHL